jgi:hypothetical protein
MTSSGKQHRRARKNVRGVIGSMSDESCSVQRLEARVRKMRCAGAEITRRRAGASPALRVNETVSRKSASVSPMDTCGIALPPQPCRPSPCLSLPPPGHPPASVQRVSHTAARILIEAAGNAARSAEVRDSHAVILPLWITLRQQRAPIVCHTHSRAAASQSGTEAVTLTVPRRWRNRIVTLTHTQPTRERLTQAITG